jgi:hypothetical protein
MKIHILCQGQIKANPNLVHIWFWNALLLVLTYCIRFKYVLSAVVDILCVHNSILVAQSYWSTAPSKTRSELVRIARAVYVLCLAMLSCWSLIHPVDESELRMNLVWQDDVVRSVMMLINMLKAWMGRHMGMWWFDSFSPILGPEVLAFGTKTERTTTRGPWEPLGPNLPSLPMSQLVCEFHLAFCMAKAWKRFSKVHHTGRGRGEGCRRHWTGSPAHNNRDCLREWPPTMTELSSWSDSWIRRSTGKVLVDHPLPARQGSLY